METPQRSSTGFDGKRLKYVISGDGKTLWDSN